MELYLAYSATLLLTFISSVLLSTWLWIKTRRGTPTRILAIFCLGVGMWNLGHLLVATGDLAVASVGRALINISYLNPAFFVHFALRLVLHVENTTEVKRWHITLLALVYSASGFLSGWMLLHEAGELKPWLSFPLYYLLSGTSWYMAIAAFIVSSLAYILLAWGWRTATTKQRRQIMWVLWTGIWGLFCSSGFVAGSLHADWFPYTMLLLPTYNILLVYGILRYEIAEVNQWVNRALAATVLLVLVLSALSVAVALSTRVGFTGLNNIPLWQIWLVAAIAIICSTLVRKPLQRIIERLIYPGVTLDQESLAGWRARLDTAENYPELSNIAEQIIYESVREPISVQFNSADTTSPALMCIENSLGNWDTHFIGWHSAAPGVSRQMEVLSSMIASAAANLALSLRLATQEKERLSQQHLSELGGLSAAIAHELRNPLNIISMAALQTEPNIRQEIVTQVQRADKLVRDILSYSGNIEVSPQYLPIAPQLEQAIQSIKDSNRDLAIQFTCDVKDSDKVFADPFRLKQILLNLLENAVQMQRASADIAVGIFVSQDATSHEVKLRVCDRGAGVARERRESIFSAFQTSRKDGHGLGLAIVRRLVEAHGGTIKVIDDDSWPSCFELCLPGDQI